MNIELIRLKKKLAVMETEGSNQVFVDLLKFAYDLPTSVCIENIEMLKSDYKIEIAKLEQKETKYKQGKLL